MCLPAASNEEAVKKTIIPSIAVLHPFVHPQNESIQSLDYFSMMPFDFYMKILERTLPYHRGYRLQLVVNTSES
jgi:hypothetical protein